MLKSSHLFCYNSDHLQLNHFSLKFKHSSQKFWGKWLPLNWSKGMLIPDKKFIPPSPQYLTDFSKFVNSSIPLEYELRARFQNMSSLASKLMSLEPELNNHWRFCVLHMDTTRLSFEVFSLGKTLDVLDQNCFSDQHCF